MSTSPVTSVTDELIAELEQEAANAIQHQKKTQEKLNASGCRDKVVSLCSVSPQELLALLAERAELKRDAERYRWIRSKHDQSDGDTWVSVWDKEIRDWVSLDRHCSMDHDGELDLDAATDTAMQNNHN